jgi:hypothetical protein
MAERLAMWQPQSGRLPLDSQFAFRHKHGVEHGHLVMSSACDAAFASGLPLVAVKLDIDKAYDTVVWLKLWNILQRLGLPSFFITLVQELYSQVPHVVSANGVASRPFYCSMGLLQGCALSPMLYNLYLAPTLVWLQELCTRDGMGPVLLGQPVPFIDYADDIVGLLTNPAQVAGFLQHASAALATINQHLSIVKCQVLVMKSQCDLGPTIAGVQVVGRMKFLGVWFDKTGSVGYNLEARLQAGVSKLGLAYRRLKDAGCLHDVSMAALVLNSDIRPTVLFGCGIWGMHGLKSGDHVKHVLQRPCSTLLRWALSVPASTAHWIVLLVTGQMPVQFWIIREFCTSWNRFLATCQINCLVHAALSLQLQLCVANTRCWLSEWDRSLEQCLPAAAYQHLHQCLVQGTPIDIALVMAEVEQSYIEVLASFGDPCTSACTKRRIAMVYRHIVMGALHKRPHWTSWSLPNRVRAVWTRFITCCGGLPVHKLCEQGIPFSQRLCTKCSQHCVANEHHVLFHCPAAGLSRQRFQQLLDWSHAPHLGAFLADNITEECAWFIYCALAEYAGMDVQPWLDNAGPGASLELDPGLSLFERGRLP